MGKATYTAIQDWMLDMGLDVWEVIAYAVIFGFSQDGESTFRGSLAYLSRKMVCSRDKTIKSLKRLAELGLIEKIEIFRNGIKFCEYKATPRHTPGTPDVPPKSGEGSTPGRPNNKVENKEENKFSPFIPPTFDEVAAYAAERHLLGRPKIDPQLFLDHYTSNGWMVGKTKMKDWRASFRTWELKRLQETQPDKPATKQHKSVNWNDIKY